MTHAGRGINEAAVYTRTDPGADAQRIPQEPTDPQTGYDIRTRRHFGVKVQNEANQNLSYRVLGYTQEDADLEHPVELATGNVNSGDEPAYESGSSPGIARLQVEITPAAAATGPVTIVFGSSPDGR